MQIHKMVEWIETESVSPIQGTGRIISWPHSYSPRSSAPFSHEAAWHIISDDSSMQLQRTFNRAIRENSIEKSKRGFSQQDSWLMASVCLIESN